MRKSFQSKRSETKLSKKERREQQFQKSLRKTAEPVMFTPTENGLWAVQANNEVTPHEKPVINSQLKRQHIAFNIRPETKSSFDLKSFLDEVRQAIVQRKEVMG